MNPALAFAATFVDELAACGLGSVCVSPGSRSAPLAMAFARHPAIRVIMHIDERSGSFFGLGMARITGLPVALLCTSGTAAAEFHPAVLEAHHSRIPLLVLTADRPPELRDVGANQAIDQIHLYGRAVRWFADPGPPEALAGADRRWRRLAARAWSEATGPPAGPVHLNLPFREPLTPEPGTVPPPVLSSVAPAPPGRSVGLPDQAVVDALTDRIAGSRRILVVAGGMPGGAALEPFLAQLGRAGAVILAEPTSQLRLAGLAVADAYDAMLRSTPAALAPPDLVLRLGAPPTSRALNGWLHRLGAPTVLLDPDGTWADPDCVATEVIRSAVAPLLAAAAVAGLPPGDLDWQRAWLGASSLTRAALDRALGRTILHEGHVVAALGRQLPAGASLTVGASMAIRDLDTFWPSRQPGSSLFANRGASGIDGVVSSGLGAAAGGGHAVILLGDLSLYHDMNGLWAIRRHRLRATIVVLDNNGGGIFSFLPQAEHPDVFEELFGTPLGLDLEDVARLHGLRFRSVAEASDLEPALASALASETPWLLAVRFSRASSVAGHRAAWAEVAAAFEQPEI